MEESKEEVDEWRDLMMSSKGIFSDFAPENCGSKSIDEIFNMKESNFGCNDHEKVGNSSKFDMKNTMLLKDDDDDDISKSSMDVGDSSVMNNGVSLAERRAIKCGFNASKICTPGFRCSSLLPSPRGSCSPYVRMLSGVSPHSLLDSPIMLPNSQFSPTTGTFISRPVDGDGQMLISASPMVAGKESDGASIMFKPHTESTSLACFRDADNQVSSAGGLAPSLVANIDTRLDFEFPMRLCEQVGVNSHDVGSPHDRKILDDLTVNPDLSSFQTCDSSVAPCLQMSHENRHTVDELATHDSFDGNHNGIYPHSGTVRTTEDGYNWRKYGQKQVKGSEYPRSYYKCTQPNCHVTKKVERSHDGQVTEIIYKGAHNHAKPQPGRKSGLGSSLPFNEASDLGDGGGSSVKANASSFWRNVQPGYNDVAGSDWRIDGLERTSSSAVTKVSDLISNTQGKPMGVLESAGTPEFSSTLASNEGDEEDAATQENFASAHDSEIEPDLKKRKKDGCYPETTLGSRSIREPRVVVQIESDIDILDDGYRWRKYGQKVVKGNPNPRSYYKCTSSGCTIRKQVERSSQCKKYVITTYEGKHNHEVPAARNSSHANSGSGSFPTAATSTQTPLNLPRSSHLPKPEPHSQDHPLHFNTKMECDNDYLRANCLGNISAGTPSFYLMKFPTMPNTTPYGPYSHHQAYASSIVPAIPDLPFPLPTGFPRSISSYCNPERSHSSVQSLYAGQQLQDTDVKLLRPKKEMRDNSYFENDLHGIDHTNSSSVHNHVTGNFRP